MNDESISKFWEYYVSLLRKTNRDGIEDLIAWLDTTDFKTAPASTQYHNNFRGGLLLHSLDVYYHMYDFKSFIDFFDIPEDTIILTSLLHDICKINTYTESVRNKKDENGNWVQVPFYEWNPEEPIGHGAKSVMLMYEHNVKPTKMERAMILNHMGYSMGDDNKKDVSWLFAMCPQTLLLHWADELATFVTEGTDIQEKYKAKMFGRNLIESNNINNQILTEGTVTVNNIKYKVAPNDSVVDGNTIGEIFINKVKVKVYIQ